MNMVPKLGAGLALLTFLGCTKLTIESNVRPDYGRKLSDLCVVVGVARSLDAPFFTQVQAALGQKLTGKGVHSAVILVGPAGGPEQTGTLYTPGRATGVGGGLPANPALPSSAELQAKAGFEPAFLLTVQMSQLGGGPKPTAVLSLSLTEAKTAQTVWKANLAMEWGASGFGGPGFMYSKETPIGLPPQEVVDLIVDRLAKDRLL